MTTWEKCCHCSEPVQGCQAACKHRLLMCPQACVFAADYRWQAFVEVAGEANPAASMRKLDVQAMTPEEQGAWLSRILAPAVVTVCTSRILYGMGRARKGWSSSCTCPLLVPYRNGRIRDMQRTSLIPSC